MTGTRDLELIDIGVNLGHDCYNADRPEVIARARAVGVVQMVVTGADYEGSLEAIAVAAADPGRMFATAGCHPHHAADLRDSESIQAISELAFRAEVVAVGECGLDYHRDFSPRPDQRAALEAQLAIAALVRKPAFLHQRDAHEDFLAIVRAHRDSLVGAVAHCFTAGRAELHAYLDLGLHIGITGWICDERRGLHLLELLPTIPAGRLMLETDAPYLLPRDLAPKPAARRNEPQFLAHVAERVAAARGESLEQLAAHTTRTAREFFGLPPLQPS